MQYLLCPRCKFRVPSNRQLCSTCGNKIAAVNAPRAVNSDQLASTDVAQKQGFWHQWLGLAGTEQEHKDSGHDGPALGET